MSWPIPWTRWAQQSNRSPKNQPDPMRHDPKRKTAEGPKHTASILRRERSREALRPDCECRKDPGVVVEIRTGDTARPQAPRPR